MCTISCWFFLFLYTLDVRRQQKEVRLRHSTYLPSRRIKSFFFSSDKRQGFWKKEEVSPFAGSFSFLFWCIVILYYIILLLLLLSPGQHVTYRSSIGHAVPLKPRHEVTTKHKKENITSGTAEQSRTRISFDQAWARFDNENQLGG